MRICLYCSSVIHLVFSSFSQTQGSWSWGTPAVLRWIRNDGYICCLWRVSLCVHILQCSCLCAGSERSRHIRILNGTIRMGPLCANCPCSLCRITYSTYSMPEHIHSLGQGPLQWKLKTFASSIPHNRMNRLCVLKHPAKSISFYLIPKTAALFASKYFAISLGQEHV